MFVGVLQTVLFFYFYVVINLSAAAVVLSKSISLGDVIERVLIDSGSNDIDNKSLDLKLNSLPSPKLPDIN